VQFSDKQGSILLGISEFDLSTLRHALMSKFGNRKLPPQGDRLGYWIPAGGQKWTVATGDIV
jgi:hypothetical protein